MSSATLNPLPARACPLAQRETAVRAQFFHRGFFYKKKVVLYEGRQLTCVPIRYRRDDFRFGEKIGQVADANLGFAGFRIHAPLNRPGYYDEVCVFLGASYFRAVARNEIYGLSREPLNGGRASGSSRSETEERAVSCSSRSRAKKRFTTTSQRSGVRSRRCQGQRTFNPFLPGRIVLIQRLMSAGARLHVTDTARRPMRPADLSDILVTSGASSPRRRCRREH